MSKKSTVEEFVCLQSDLNPQLGKIGLSSVIEYHLNAGQYLTLCDMVERKYPDGGWGSRPSNVGKLLLTDFGLKYNFEYIGTINNWGTIMGTEDQINWLLMHT